MVCGTKFWYRLLIIFEDLTLILFSFQGDVRRPGEKREQQIGRILGNVAPSMLLCSLSEAICFLFGRNLCCLLPIILLLCLLSICVCAILQGALSTMPAVKSFALYAAVAILLDFALQMTAFVALLSLDCRRQDSNRSELLCCIKVSHRRGNKPNKGFLLPFMKKYYAPALLNQYSRIIVVKI